MIPTQEKYCLTVTEAAEYFNIGEKKLRSLVQANPGADFVLHIGAKILIKRRLLERYLDRQRYL